MTRRAFQSKPLRGVWRWKKVGAPSLRELAPLNRLLAEDDTSRQGVAAVKSATRSASRHFSRCNGPSRADGRAPGGFCNSSPGQCAISSATASCAWCAWARGWIARVCFTTEPRLTRGAGAESAAMATGAARRGGRQSALGRADSADAGSSKGTPQVVRSVAGDWRITGEVGPAEFRSRGQAIIDVPDTRQGSDHQFDSGTEAGSASPTGYKCPTRPGHYGAAVARSGDPATADQTPRKRCSISYSRAHGRASERSPALTEPRTTRGSTPAAQVGLRVSNRTQIQPPFPFSPRPL